TVQRKGQLSRGRRGVQLSKGVKVLRRIFFFTLMMNVNLAYHVGGKFDGIGTNFGYVGGHVVTIDEVDPNQITL
ncbi:hypothetical protein LINPERHAP1_LOCUS29080, partial [Linum perenne]